MTPNADEAIAYQRRRYAVMQNVRRYRNASNALRGLSPNGTSTRTTDARTRHTTALTAAAATMPRGLVAWLEREAAVLTAMRDAEIQGRRVDIELRWAYSDARRKVRTGVSFAARGRTVDGPEVSTGTPPPVYLIGTVVIGYDLTAQRSHTGVVERITDDRKPAQVFVQVTTDDGRTRTLEVERHTHMPHYLPLMSMPWQDAQVGQWVRTNTGRELVVAELPLEQALESHRLDNPIHRPGVPRHTELHAVSDRTHRALRLAHSVIGEDGHQRSLFHDVVLPRDRQVSLLV